MSRVLGEQGLRAAQQSNGTWLVQAAPAPGVTTLQPVTVSGRQDTARGAVDGIVATRSLAGTKTDTSLLETPQVINVITRDQMNQQGANSVAEALRYTPGVIAEPNGGWTAWRCRAIPAVMPCRASTATRWSAWKSSRAPHRSFTARACRADC
ncbi:hypothetical protein G6F65_020859 [Rhizopus arrhizus]|nr:hypothetical protein G6F31_018379 [Rhizopus arrhizus]KAG1246111.1 hypothetical protein G6F65_020859 [Rhizopus arrhizus]